MDSKPDEPKSTKAAEPLRPFLLEVTPEELVIPPTGNLEVKIRNPTDSKCKVYVYFDSFFWLMKINGKFVNINRGSSNSMCFGSVMLWPEDRFTLSIGYHDAKYEDKERCDEFCPPFNCDTHFQRTVDVPPSKRNNYSYERPEGVLIIKYHLNVDIKDCSEGRSIFEINFGKSNKYDPKPDKCDPKPDKCDPDKHPMKKMDLYLKDETEDYKMYREHFKEIRKEQERKARWGHVLVNEDGVTFEKFRDLDGTIREFGDRCESLSDWEYDIPTDLKQFDALSDEEILKIRKERKEKIDEKHKKEEEEAKKRAEESIKKVKEKWKKEVEEIKKKEEDERIKKEKEAAAAAAAKEKSKVKTVEKSKRPEEPSQNVQKSTKSNVSAAPPKVDVTPTSKKPVEKPDDTKNKKKKANPCCSVM